MEVGGEKAAEHRARRHGAGGDVGGIWTNCGWANGSHSARRVPLAAPAPPRVANVPQRALAVAALQVLAAGSEQPWNARRASGRAVLQRLKGRPDRVVVAISFSINFSHSLLCKKTQAGFCLKSSRNKRAHDNSTSTAGGATSGSGTSAENKLSTNIDQEQTICTFGYDLAWNHTGNSVTILRAMHATGYPNETRHQITCHQKMVNMDTVQRCLF